MFHDVCKTVTKRQINRWPSTLIILLLVINNIPATSAQSSEQSQQIDCSSLDKAFESASYRAKNSYRKSRKLLFSKVASQINTGQVTAIYTGRKTPSRRRKAPHGYNCEHVFPRAWMSRKGSRAYKKQEADLHNLYPSEIKINSRRGHLPFGLVGRQHLFRIGLDSKIGLDHRGEEVIQARPEVRGDIARVLLYMALKWERPLALNQELKVLQDWAKLDPPSQEEERRDQIIHKIQGNRNPFVSCPRLLSEAVRRLGAVPRGQGVKLGQGLENHKTSKSSKERKTLVYSWLQNQGKEPKFQDRLAQRIPLPPGAQRVAAERHSFGAWLRGLPLLSADSPVKLHNGSLKWTQELHQAVIDIDIGKRDRQQCADAVIRFRAEYLFSRKKENLPPKVPISFNYTTGDKIPYSRWRKGDRPKVEEYKRKGRKRWRVKWSRRSKYDGSYKQFRRYLDNIFSYAGTASLSKELSRRPVHDIRIGDIYLRGGFPGHAVLVVDLAEHPKYGKIMLLAQSYMPAQSPHILKNLEDRELSPWFKVPRQGQLITPEWTFSATNIYRFKGRDLD